jgi:hypothetical protein
MIHFEAKELPVAIAVKQPQSSYYSVQQTQASIKW